MLSPAPSGDQELPPLVSPAQPSPPPQPERQGEQQQQHHHHHRRRRRREMEQSMSTSGGGLVDPQVKRPRWGSWQGCGGLPGPPVAAAAMTVGPSSQVVWYPVPGWGMGYPQYGPVPVPLQFQHGPAIIPPHPRPPHPSVYHHFHHDHTTVQHGAAAAAAHAAAASGGVAGAAGCFHCHHHQAAPLGPPPGWGYPYWGPCGPVPVPMPPAAGAAAEAAAEAAGAAVPAVVPRMSAAAAPMSAAPMSVAVAAPLMSAIPSLRAAMVPPPSVAQAIAEAKGIIKPRLSTVTAVTPPAEAAPVTAIAAAATATATAAVSAPAVAVPAAAIAAPAGAIAAGSCAAGGLVLGRRSADKENAATGSKRNDGVQGAAAALSDMVGGGNGRGCGPADDERCITVGSSSDCGAESASQDCSSSGEGGGGESGCGTGCCGDESGGSEKSGDDCGGSESGGVGGVAAKAEEEAENGIAVGPAVASTCTVASCAVPASDEEAFARLELDPALWIVVERGATCSRAAQCGYICRLTGLATRRHYHAACGHMHTSGPRAGQPFHTHQLEKAWQHQRAHSRSRGKAPLPRTSNDVADMLAKKAAAAASAEAAALAARGVGRGRGFWRRGNGTNGGAGNGGGSGVASGECATGGACDGSDSHTVAGVAGAAN
ncbi:unnamed protein product [Phaeothamnion confervicola]